MAAVAIAGAVGPTWQYLSVRPVVAAALRQPVAIGVGVWLNALGCVLVAAVSLVALAGERQKQRQPSGRKAVGHSARSEAKEQSGTENH
jgi:hypothetical protein